MRGVTGPLFPYFRRAFIAGEMMMMRTRNHLVFFFFHVLWYLSLRAPTAGDQMLKSIDLIGIVMKSNYLPYREIV